jgi:glycosyltransferase involved in cell wall biosynthesis
VNVRGSAGLEVAYLLPDPGIPVGGTKGASVHVESLCAALSRLGVDVTLYAARVSGPMTSRGSDTVRVIPIDVGPVASGAKAEATRISAIETFFDGVERHLTARKPSCIVERLSLFAGRGAELAKSLGVARVVEVNAPVAEERRRHFGLRFEEEACRAEHRALSNARVVAVSAPLASWAIGMGASTASVVANGADVDGLDPSRLSLLAPRTRRRLGFSMSQPVIGFAGSFKPWHGLDVLIDAVALIAGSVQLGLLIVGDGPERARVTDLLRRLPDGVTVATTGAVAFSRVPEYVAAMDIAAAPYVATDTFYFCPLKVVEAMAAGRAVVASDFPPIRQLVGETGVLVSPGSSHSLAQALYALVSDANARDILGSSARARAVERSSWSSVAEALVAEIFAALDASSEASASRGLRIGSRKGAGR